MSGVYPVFETDIPGAQPHLSVSGRALSDELETLEKLTEAIHIPSLMHFFSTSAEEVAGLMGLEEGEMPRFPVEEEWFSPSEALLSVRALRTHLHSSRDEMKNSKWILADLDAIEETLITAEHHGIRFHFAIDI